MAAIVVLMVVTLMPIASHTSTAAALSSDDQYLDDLNLDDQYFVNQINALRSSRGLGTLAVDGNMVDLATGHTAEMMGAGSLFHAPKLSIGVSGPWAKLGENVGRGSNAEIVWNAFVNSPAHYANLVDASFTHVGVSVMWDGGGQLWTTQRFVSRAGSAVDEASAPRVPREPVVRAFPAAEPQVSEAAAASEEAEPHPPPPPPADPGRVRAVLDVLHASPD